MKKKTWMDCHCYCNVCDERLGLYQLDCRKEASADGSVIVSYSADSYGMFGFLCHYPAMTHESGTMRPIYEWDTRQVLGADKGGETDL